MGLSFQSKLLECCVAVLLLQVTIGVVGIIKDGEQGYASQWHLSDGLWKLKNDEGVPEDKIREWWYKAEAVHRNFPRVYPWCFSLDTKRYPMPAQIAPFVKAMEEVNDVRGYDPDLHSWEAYEAKGTGLITKISVRRMVIEPEKTSVIGEAGPSNMNQWMAVIVRMRRPFRKIYVQSYGGPLGVPTGEFSDEIECGSRQPGPGPPITEAQIVPCHFAPKSAYTWPNVFVYDSAMPQTFMIFKFRWTETHCLETTFVHFIFIVIDDSQKHEVVLSPLYRFTTLDSPSAVPFPYHPFHSFTNCSKEKTDAVPIQDKRRLIANKEYDDCVLGITQPDKTGINRDKCPPGPFKCTSKWTTAAEWKSQGIHWEHSLIDDPKDKCCELVFPLQKPTGLRPSTTPSYAEPTSAPSATESPQQKRQKEQEVYFAKRTRKFEIKYKITHGDFCILAMLILVPLADFISRNFKDYPDVKRFGLGCWIILHVLIHTAGLMLMWWAMGLIIGSSPDRKGDNVIVEHYVAGGVAFGLQHIQFVTGLKRGHSDSKSFARVLIHAACGYLSHCVGYVAIALSPAGTERKWMSLALFLIGLVSFVALFIAEKIQEKILNVVPRRAQWPILQRISVFGGPPPMGRVKIMIVVLSMIAQVGIYLYMLLVHSAERLALQKIAREELQANETFKTG